MQRRQDRPRRRGAIDVDAILDRVDLTNVAKERLDINAVVSTVDIDSIIDRLDLDALAARIDVDAILDRVDLTNVAKERLDINAVVSTVDIDSIIDRLDLDALAARIDVDAILDRVDLTNVAKERLDINAVVSTVDIDSIIDRARPRHPGQRGDRRDRPAGDHPSIERVAGLRDGSNVRVQSIEADRAVERVIDRFRPHRRIRPDSQLPGSAST